jgi:hypothetical protein
MKKAEPRPQSPFPNVASKLAFEAYTKRALWRAALALASEVASAEPDSPLTLNQLLEALEAHKWER